MTKEGRGDPGWSAGVRQKAEELAALVSEERFGVEGAPLEFSFSEIEEIGHQVGRLTAGAVDRALQQRHAERLPDTAPCPGCGRECPLERRERSIQTRDGAVALDEPVGRCHACERDFFPQRPLLGLDGRAYSPAVLERIVAAGGLAKSFEVGAKLLALIGEIDVSSRQVNNLTASVGEELAAERDQRTAACLDRPLPREPTRVEPAPQLACVEVDGGRMQTRAADAGPGVQQAHWRETKNAGFYRMKTTSHGADPHPDLPGCFADRGRMHGLLPGLGEPTPAADPPPKSGSEWRPEALFRTCLSSLASSEEFGPMMAAEADARGFFAAGRRALLGDGLAYNWSIQRKHFPTFEPIVDFVHPVERLYAAARAVVSEDDGAVWSRYAAWAEAVWQGDVGGVIEELARRGESLGPPPPDAEEADPRRVLAETLTYLRNNRSRMDYPRYRQEGLPVTSALIESLVKEVNHRVKGSEKFWNDGPSGEAILQVRAALLSHDDRLARHIRNRPGSPYARRSSKTTLATAA